ncbi:MAG TPA: hypothetical protein VLY20_10605 [Nitrospiria bacterium]|nr:hypothetical protein [Nitrospiria bacterium]
MAGKRRNPYKQEKRLQRLSADAVRSHNYTKRSENFLRRKFQKAKGKKKRTRALALKVIHYLDGKDRVRREDIMQDLLADQSSYRSNEVDNIIRLLHQAELVRAMPGRYSMVEIR